MIRGKKHWLWRAVDQDGVVLDVLVQSRRDREFAPADATARTADEAVQVAGPGATLPLRSRSDQQLVLPPPRSPPCPPVSSRPDPGLPDLGRGHRRGRFGIAVVRPARSTCLVATRADQVDG